MKLLLIALSLIGLVGCGANADVEADVEALEKAGARIIRDSEGNVITVDLREPGITDSGLEHIKGLTNLEALGLFDTDITHAGLVNISGMTKLRELKLGNTGITDAGLEHIKGLANLESLLLRDTKVTDAGVAALKESLPKCRIYK